MKPSRNKWVLITGASSGIGESFAHELAAKGNHIILVARSESKLVALAEHLRKKHGIELYGSLNLNHNLRGVGTKTLLKLVRLCSVWFAIQPEPTDHLK